ncbi:hypothetical protein JYT83_00350, partial [bacterium AH-315-F18]|nr:hypothetical protein [bacterium AH-315-F18]
MAKLEKESLMTEITTQAESSIEKPKRNPTPRTTVFLYVRAGGRCQFDGCSKYLLEHEPTGTTGNFAEKAHIYGFKEKAARGSETGRPAAVDISSIDNLMLLCQPCHHLVDSVEPQTYPVEKLKKFKREHEERIRILTKLAKNRTSIPILLKGLVAGRTVDVSDEEMQSAAAPNLLKRLSQVEIDLTEIPDEPDDGFWGTA